MANNDSSTIHRGENPAENVLDKTLAHWKSTRASAQELSESTRGEIIRNDFAPQSAPAMRSRR